MKDEKKPTDNVFEAENYYMLRTPALPLGSYFNHNNYEIDKFVKEKINDSTFLEAIAIANPNLKKSLQRYKEDLFENKDTKKVRNIISSLIKYHTRMSTRPTPFGTFASVSLGEFTDKEVSKIKIQGVPKKAVRPDMEWLLGLVKELEKYDNIFYNLKVKANPTIHNVGDRILVKVITLYGQSKTNEEREISVSLTNPLEKVLKLTKNTITIGDILHELVRAFPDQKKGKLLDYLKKLIEQEILISELRPSINENSLMCNLSTTLQRIYPLLHDEDKEKYYIKKVIEIDKEIAEFNQINYKQTHANYIDIINNMKSINSSRSYLKLDSYSKVENNYLPSKLKPEIEDAANCLWKLNRHKKNTVIEDYKDKFVENYGLFREIPILEVINEETGIGFPKFNNNKQQDHLKDLLHTQEPARQILLNTLVQRAIKNNDKEILLDDDHLDHLCDISYSGEYPEGMDIYAEVIREENLESKYRIILNSSAGSQGVGKSFGRFLYNHSKMKQKFMETNKNVIKKNKEIEYIELIYTPSLGKLSNVMQTVIPTNYKLDLSNINEDEITNLKLNDIMLLCDGDSLRLKSKMLNKEIRVISSHMFNYHNSPILCRLLLEITDSIYSHWNVFDWGLLKFNEYLPRVRRNNIILYPQTWRFIYDKNHKISRDSEHNIKSSIEKWIKVWEIPRYVYLVYSDLKLLIDLYNDMHVKELINETKKNHQFELQEIIGNFNDRIVESENGKHMMEIIVPVICQKKQTDSNKKFYDISQNFYSGSNIVKRTFLPGEECLFIKLYCNYSEQDLFISNELFKKMENMKDKKLISKWFYIRYYDTESHLRIRIFGNKETLNSNVLPEITNFVRYNIKKGKLKSFSIAPYEREIERYGGPYVFRSVENYFYIDSYVSSMLLKQMRENYAAELTDKVTLTIIIIIKMLYDFKLTNDEIMNLIYPESLSKAFMDEFRKRKKYLNFVIGPQLDFTCLKNEKGGEMIMSLLNERISYIQEISENIENLQNENLLTQQQIKILIDSLVHMTCNRFLGDTAQEDCVRALIQLLIKSFEYQNQNTVL
ncbi:lantibiotic dehydratase [Gracilibacillus sp. HCP3S3_G5_1]|uniref:lantibiotic dehydratase n=1 Tax=unclassified Gracilibacillus TaxID=2625209 RepID=UPI003F8881F1